VPAPSLLIALCSAALALPVAGCGGESDKGLLTGAKADRLSESLSDARAALDDERPRCGAARKAAQQGAARASALGSKVDAELRDNLVEGFNHLVDEVNAGCDRPEPTPTPTPTPTVEETPTVVETPTEEPTEVPTEEPTPVPTVTAEPTVELTAPPEDTGGADFEEDG